MKKILIAEDDTNINEMIRTSLTQAGYSCVGAYSGTEAKLLLEHEETFDTHLLLEELFTYTKLQNTSYELDLGEFNFTRIVMNCLFDFYEQWQKAEITPELEITEASAMVLCNESAVKRILTNILRNATIHGEGTIQITYQVQDEQVVFRCSNPVSSSEEPDPEQVFDRFYRADAARSQTSNGLGLSIAKELTHRMNGNIQAALEGGIFTIEICFSLLS